jgi:hypothetical protein
VKNEEAIHRVEEKKEYPTYSKRKTKWIGHILRTKYLIKHVVQENTKGKNRRERRLH